MDFEHEIRLLKIAESIDEEIQLHRGGAEVVNEILNDMVSGVGIEKVFSLLVTQRVGDDDMVTTELRKLYNTAVMRIAEERFDPLDYERDE